MGDEYPDLKKYTTVRAMFRLVTIEAHAHGVSILKFQAQYDDTIPEHRRFQKATPWGEFSMQVDNPLALKQFELGKYYYLDMTLVDKKE